MNLGLYFYQLRRWILLAVIPAIVITAATYVYVAREAKTYQTTVTLYVQQPSSNGSSPGGTDVYTSQALIPTYSQMISTPAIGRSVNRELAGKYPGYNLLSHSLSVSARGSGPTQVYANTQLMDVTVSDTVPQRAADAANTVARVFIREIIDVQRKNYQGSAKALQRQIDSTRADIGLITQRIGAYKGAAAGLQTLKSQLTAYQGILSALLTSVQEFNVGRNTALNGVKIFSPAEVPTAPIGPHPFRNAALAGFIALLLCLAALFLYDYFDDTPRTPEEVEKILGAPILGTVQEYDPGKTGQLITARHARSPLAEAYRVIRTNLQFTNVDSPLRSIVVTSPSPAEGKTTTISNLANVFAEAGRRVLLVDADLRRPSLHRVFAMDRREGLTNMLVGRSELNGHGVQETSRPNLALIASGPVPPRPADLLGSARMQDLVGHLEESADLVLIDSPPILAVTDAAILSTVTDGVILVVDPAKSKKRDMKRSQEAIEAVGGKILGVVINRLNKRGSSYYYYYYHHNYGYAYNYQYQYNSAPAGEAVEGDNALPAPATTAAPATTDPGTTAPVPITKSEVLVAGKPTRRRRNKADRAE